MSNLSSRIFKYRSMALTNINKLHSSKNHISSINVLQLGLINQLQKHEKKKMEHSKIIHERIHFPFSLYCFFNPNSCTYIRIHSMVIHINKILQCISNTIQQLVPTVQLDWCNLWRIFHLGISFKVFQRFIDDLLHFLVYYFLSFWLKEKWYIVGKFQCI